MIMIIICVINIILNILILFKLQGYFKQMSKLCYITAPWKETKNNTLYMYNILKIQWKSRNYVNVSLRNYHNSIIQNTLLMHIVIVL